MTSTALLAAATLLAAGADSFGSRQESSPRVAAARRERDAEVRALFAKVDLAYPPEALYLRVFKREQRLEVWARGGGDYRLVTTYSVCATSGSVGPKRARGDGQVPEGFYELDRWNPTSNFYLSLGLNYPNASDRLLATSGDPGGDIFIHGDCVTIGCVPIQDDIKALYLMALDTRVARGGRIPVHVFPRRLDEQGLRELVAEAGDDASLRAFWESLAPGFVLFERERVVPRVTIDARGGYVVRSGRLAQ